MVADALKGAMLGFGAVAGGSFSFGVKRSNKLLPAVELSSDDVAGAAELLKEKDGLGSVAGGCCDILSKILFPDAGAGVSGSGTDF